MAADMQQTPFVKQLAANDRKTRDAAVVSLSTFLSGRRALPPLELLKLHKGLFYCMWMSDRPLVQQSLATSLSSLVSVLPSETVIPFLRAFWLTMAREWTMIDVLRMEKFLLVTRRYFGASLAVLKKKGWKDRDVEEMLGLWMEVPCNADDVKVPNGLRYHVIDIWVDELERAGVLEMEEEERDALLEKLLEPLRSLKETSPTKTVRVKAKEALEDDRLPGNEKVEVEEEEEKGQHIGNQEGDDVWGGFDD